MKYTIAALLALMPLAAGAADYKLSDEGDFVPAGHRVEFADRFGWRRYQVNFDFALDRSGRALSKESRLEISIAKRDGKNWRYSCRAQGRNALSANVNYLQGKGISVVAECRIAENEFAKAVDLDQEDVGAPTLVFHAVIRDGKVMPGAQRGLYFLSGGQIESSELNAYASRDNDPSNLAVLFQSN